MWPLQNEKLQIMSHAVVGFPSLAENQQAIAGLVNAGVRIIELQVPFSDPVADGHTLVNACYKALGNGGSVKATLDLAAKVSSNHPDALFIIMSYLNPLYRYGLPQLFEDAAAAGIKGLIIPDMPVEEFEPWLPLLDELQVAPVLMVTPNTPEKRIARITQSARGMIYVVSRMGVTGRQTHWGPGFKHYIARIRRHTALPLAVGFGVRNAEDLVALRGTAEVAALCSQYIEWQDKNGSDEAAIRMKNLLEQAGLTEHQGY